jgi:hypothetical protein
MGNRTPGPLPIWADTAQGGALSASVLIGGGAGYSTRTARRPAVKEKKRQGQQRPSASSKAG